jgi:sec-independent protein translocase protein TatB
MFGIDSGELLVIAVVALVVIGPKDLPRVMRTIGNFIGQMRGMARHFRSGVDNMIRESELGDMEKKWQADNERIMREHPMAPAPPAPSGKEDWPAKDAGSLGEVWPEPKELPPPPKPARAAARSGNSRPKPPPRRSPGATSGGSAPPIPKAAPASKDEGA